jgi:hypothetical protein
MTTIDTREIMRSLIPFIGETINKGECGGMHFTLIVWCNCCDCPLFIGGNDGDTPRILKMIRSAADTILLGHEMSEGHA